MLKKRKLLKLSFVILTILLLVGFALPEITNAQADNLLWGNQQSNVQAGLGLGNTDPRVMAANIVRIALGFLGIIAVLLIIYAGFLWMTAGGDVTKVERAKKTLIAALIGIVIILSSFAIATFILNRLLAATGGSGGPGTSCTATNVGSCSGCTRCVATGPTTYSWTLDNSCSPSCMGTGPGPGPINCDANLLTPGVCDIDQPACDAAYGVGNSICDPLSACTCQLLGGVGDPCDADTSTPTCDADDTMCMADLHCEADILSPDLCTCVGAPVIDWISPVDSLDVPNGAPGNLVTIGGRYFGTTPGTVYFSSLSGINVAANFPNTVNPACTDFWETDQIIVVVPAGAAIDGPVRVERADMEIDDTNDLRGPAVNDFDINGIVRPGLCQLSTSTGAMNVPVSYVGINLFGAQAFFGGRTSSVQAINHFVFTDNLGTMAGPNTDLVPNIETGRTTTFASSSGELSNFLRFYKEGEPYNPPQITSFDPASGAPGQYVTIYGSGFGRVRGASRHVYFGPTNPANEANYNFPDVCAGSVWSDNMVIVKVPSGPGNITDIINMELPSGVIDTSGLTPPDFIIDDTLPLAPSLCNITPTMGPNFSTVSLWGEYFGTHDAVNSIVRFHYLNDQFGPLAPGGPIISWGTVGDADKTVAIVHGSAASGPVRLENNGNEGNGINFRIGECADDTDCGVGGVCCPLGTFQEGRCAADDPALGGNGDTFVTFEDCYVDIPSSVYEWDFSTQLATTSPLGGPCYIDPVATPSCDPSDPPCGVGVCDPGTCTCQLPGLNSCSGYSLMQCVDTIFCPNSPGQCSVDGGGATTTTGIGCTDAVCDNLGACTTPPCTYNASMNRCVDMTQGTGGDCSLNSNTITADINGNTVVARCELYGSPIAQGRWHIDTSASCPTSTPGWLSIPGNRCVNTIQTCDVCDSGFRCFDDNDLDDQGICALNRTICPSGSSCGVNPANGLDECIRVDNPSCDCCCEIGQDARDCCTPLTCEGTCGSDALDDGSGYGECSGCWIDTDSNGFPSPADQAESDQACNCSGTDGKYCDINDPAYPSGVCRDCGSLSSPTECTSHSASCCVDAMDSNSCSGGAGDQSLIIGDTPDLGYCAYFSCDPIVPTVCDTASSTTGVYRNVNTCTTECAVGMGVPGGLSCFDPFAGNCGLTCAMGYGCMGTTGCTSGGCAPGDTSCLCCCDPTTNSCSAINTSLFCQEDTSPCTSANRGMCCGCDQDSDCSPVGVDPVLAGCSVDTCCRPRPTVANTVPPDTTPDTTNVCRNAKIEVEFNMPMDIASFSGEVIVVGDYGSSPCPDGTTYLASESFQKKYNNIFVKAFNRLSVLVRDVISTIVPPRLASAYTIPTATTNYCAILGGTNGYHNAAGNGVLEFSPDNLLDGNRRYYAIVKGDADLLDSVNSGVLNNYGVGMNEFVTATPMYRFNGLTYRGSYIWSFVTLDDQGPNNGVCTLDHIDIEPSSYLFKTLTNDANENDVNPLANNFDKVKDSDKVFVALPKSFDGQLLSPVAEYNWTWGWSSDNPPVADEVLPNVLTDDKRLVRTGTTITDGKAVMEALATIAIDNVHTPTTFGSSIAGTADVYVFLCENPWPEEVAGIWIPWRDEDHSAPLDCVIGSGPCYNTNYEFYYCRDEGRFGGFDDLPSILQESAIIRGESATILKEAFFLREESTSATTSLGVINEGSGGTVTATWNTVADPLVTGYNLYWGTAPGRIRDFAEVRNSGADDHDYVDCTLGAGNVSCDVSNLVDGGTYYFNLTAIYDTGTESEFMGQIEVVPEDTQAPAAPIGLITSSTVPGEVSLLWTPVTDADSYIVNYGVTPLIPGSSENIGDESTVIISGLTSGNTYYFSIQAVDAAGNVSGPSIESPEPVL